MTNSPAATMTRDGAHIMGPNVSFTPLSSPNKFLVVGEIIIHDCGAWPWSNGPCKLVTAETECIWQDALWQEPLEAAHMIIQEWQPKDLETCIY